ncbi:G1 family glutamic endopeptidase [Catenulispora yoronensis]
MPRRFAVLGVSAFSLATVIGFFAPAQAQIDPNAGSPTTSVVDCGDGSTVTLVSPHPGFSAASATDAQLEANGLPPRPQDAADLAEWQSFVAMPNDPTPHCGTADGHVRTSHPIVAPGTSDAAPAAVTPDVGSSANYHSANWSGYQSFNKTYTDAYGKWKVPNAGARPSSAFTYSSTWVGIGSGNSRSQPLIQAGSDSYNEGQPWYDLWWEMYPQNSSQSIGIVSPGDTIYSHAHLTANNDWVIVEDLTSGLGKGQTHSYKTTGFSTSTQAEWIVERPDFGGTLYPWRTPRPRSRAPPRPAPASAARP